MVGFRKGHDIAGVEGEEDDFSGSKMLLLKG